MKRPGKYLKFYIRCMKTGIIEKRYNLLWPSGLCYSTIEGSKYLDLFYPDRHEFYEIHSQGLCEMYWGSGMRVNEPGRSRQFTELRQNIVLFMAAMNGEL